MENEKKDDKVLHFERYVLTLQHQYVTNENHVVRTMNIDEPIKVMYMMSPLEYQMAMPKVVVINEMIDKLRDRLLFEVEELK